MCLCSPRRSAPYSAGAYVAVESMMREEKDDQTQWRDGQTVAERCVENDDSEGGDNSEGADDGDRESGVRLPPELWATILDRAAAAPHERFVVARVSRWWRNSIADGDIRAGRKSVRMGAYACRIRVAEKAVVSDNAHMLAWALASLEQPVVDNAVWRFWLMIARVDAVECAKVLRKHGGMWPLKCAARCLCRSDPHWNPAPDAHQVALTVHVEEQCRNVSLMIEAVSARHTRIEALLVDWHLSHPGRWVRLAFVGAIEKGHVNTMQRLWDTYRPFVHMDGALERAARFNQTRAMDWIHRTAPDRDAADRVLIEAARHNAVDSIVWLCEHQFIGELDGAAVVALTRGHHDAARAMIPYLGLFRIYLDAKDHNMVKVLRSAAKNANMKDDAKAVWEEIVETA